MSSDTSLVDQPTPQLQLQLAGLDESQIPPSLVKHLSSFITMLRELFSSLKPDISDAEKDMPEVKQMSQEIRELSESLARILQEIIKDCQSSLEEMNGLMLCDPSILENNERFSTYTENLKKIVSCANSRCRGGIDKMDDWQQEVAQFRASSVSKYQNINKKIEAAKKKRRTLRDKQVANGKAEVPQVKTLALSILRACIVPLVAVVSDRISENIEEKLGFIRVDTAQYIAEKGVISKLIAQTNSDIYQMGESAQWWQGAGNNILEIRNPLTQIKTAPIAPDVAQEIQVKILVVVNVLTQFKAEVLEVLHDVSVIEPSLTNAVEDFESHIRSLVPTLSQLATVEDIISLPIFKSSHGEKFPSRIGELTRLLSTRLEIVRAVFRSWSSHLQVHQPTDPMTFVAEISRMLREVPSLIWAAQPTYDAIYGVMVKDISNRKSKMFEVQRKREDRDGLSEEQGRRLTSQEEALGKMKKLHKAMRDISIFSTELSLSLLHFNGSGTHTTPLGADQDATEHLPKNPFDVPEDVVQRVSNALQVETTELKVLASRLLGESK